MINSFGILTEPLRFRRLLPESVHGPFREAIRGALGLLCEDLGAAEALTDRWWSLLAQDFQSEYLLIRAFRAALEEYCVSSEVISKALDERAQSIERLVLPFIVGDSMLDWGCGDGRVSRNLPIKKLLLLDIEDRRSNSAAGCFYLYDEENLPDTLEEGSVDTLLLATVLHHSKNPGMTVRHSTRLTRKRAIVIESVPGLQHPIFSSLGDSFLVERSKYEYCGFTDWFYNRVFCHDVQVTYNYLPAAGWVQMFESAGFSLVHYRELGIDQPLVPEWHALLVFDNCL